MPTNLTLNTSTNRTRQITASPVANKSDNVKHDCLLDCIQSVLGETWNNAELRKQFGENIPATIHNLLENSSDDPETQLLLLHHLDFSYDLNMNKDKKLDNYLGSNEEQRSLINNEIAKATQQKVLGGSKLDPVVATYNLANVIQQDIDVELAEFSNEELHIRYTPHSQSAAIAQCSTRTTTQQPIRVRLKQETYTAPKNVAISPSFHAKPLSWVEFVSRDRRHTYLQQPAAINPAHSTKHQQYDNAENINLQQMYLGV